jgi:hypothetical protein
MAEKLHEGVNREIVKKFYYSGASSCSCGSVPGIDETEDGSFCITCECGTNSGYWTELLDAIIEWCRRQDRRG